jgi:hypothetical protein
MSDPLKIASVQFYLNAAANHAVVAHYLASDSGDYDYHVRCLIEGVRKAADKLGFDFIDRKSGRELAGNARALEALESAKWTIEKHLDPEIGGSTLALIDSAIAKAKGEV